MSYMRHNRNPRGLRVLHGQSMGTFDHRPEFGPWGGVTTREQIIVWRVAGFFFVRCFELNLVYSIPKQGPAQLDPGNAVQIHSRPSDDIVDLVMLPPNFMNSYESYARVGTMAGVLDITN